jgi:hypothetical protein
MNIKYNEIIRKIDILNKIVSDANQIDKIDEYIEEYSNSKVTDKYFFLDPDKELNKDVINYNKLVKNNIVLANIILQKLG